MGVHGVAQTPRPASTLFRGRMLGTIAPALIFTQPLVTTAFRLPSPIRYSLTRLAVEGVDLA